VATLAPVPRRIGFVLVPVAIAAAAVVLLTRTDGGPGKPGSGIATSPPGATTPPGRPRPPAPGREGVRRGGKGRPDEPAAGTTALLGIADQKPETFSNPLFRSLQVRRTRLNTPWNSIDTEPERLGAWLSAAGDAGLEPLVAFEHGRGELCPAQPCRLPPVAAYRRAVAKFRARYPWVDHIQPWNEANSATQPTGTHPERAAAYYEAVRQACARCVVPAADLLDSANIGRWVGRFRAALRGPAPRLWGLHNYSDTNRFRDTGTRSLLDAVPGEIWLTEAGGIVSFRTADGRVALPPDEQRAARATRYLLRLAAAHRDRIKRIYVYQWRIDFPGNRFDAGLVSWENAPRPALAVVRAHRDLLR
jgi:hypothetical protein